MVHCIGGEVLLRPIIDDFDLGEGLAGYVKGDSLWWTGDLIIFL